MTAKSVKQFMRYMKKSIHNLMQSRCAVHQNFIKVHDIVTDLINALWGNSSVNTNTGNNRRENVFYLQSVPGGRMEL
jgi:hypothetical protein